MALVVTKEVALDTLIANEVINAFRTLLAMEVATVVALIVTDSIVLWLALLLFEAQVGGQDEHSTDDGRHEPESTKILHTYLCRHLDSLLQIDALV